jgi:hypothetical protein
MTLDSQLTILIPTSPIPRHPATDLIEECVNAIRFYFPAARAIIMADGVRPQVEHRRGQYEEYKKRLSARIREGALGPTELLEFPEYSQQANMTRLALAGVDTPLILFVEHDAILRTAPPIAFPAILNLLLAGEANLVRFYNWADIWHEHAPLMRGEFTYAGARFVKTVQYSQWPLVSRTDYHRRILDEWFIPGQHKMIETVMYGPVARSRDWDEHKIVVYLDETVTFTHRDGRTDEATGQRDPAGW